MFNRQEINPNNAFNAFDFAGTYGIIVKNSNAYLTKNFYTTLNRIS